MIISIYIDVNGKLINNIKPDGYSTMRNWLVTNIGSYGSKWDRVAHFDERQQLRFDRFYFTNENDVMLFKLRFEI